ncbi:MAG: hypothetical protein IJW18_04965 [Lachnospiraceae bacterium]|nr:hypothetical protein [Lachnospiraceae bacterium]
MTDILLLASFHFKESNIDFTSEETQKQLDDLAKSISAFFPDAVAVELDKSKFIEPINISDKEWENSLSNEAFSLGGRIATFSGLQYIHPIDKIFPLSDGIICEDNIKIIQPRIDYLQKADCSNTIREQMLVLNSNEYAIQDANMYLDINSINPDGNYTMSRYLADWYYRNLCIFSNIQALSKKYKRIVILYGAGHIPILKDLINTSDSMNLIDASIFL